MFIKMSCPRACGLSVPRSATAAQQHALGEFLAETPPANANRLQAYGPTRRGGASMRLDYESVTLSLRVASATKKRNNYASHFALQLPDSHAKAYYITARGGRSEELTRYHRPRLTASPLTTRWVSSPTSVVQACSFADI